MVKFAATSARQSYPHLRRAAAEPPLPGGEKRKGRRPGCSGIVRLLCRKRSASRRCQCQSSIVRRGREWRVQFVRKRGHSTFLEGDRVVLRGLNTTWEAQGRWHAMFGPGRDDRETTNADGGAKGMTGRGMRRRGLGHASAAADCLVPHCLAQHSPPRRPPRSAPKCPRLARGMVKFAATSARQSYPISAGQRRSRRYPAERKGRGGGWFVGMRKLFRERCYTARGLHWHVAELARVRSREGVGSGVFSLCRSSPITLIPFRFRVWG